MKFISNKVFVLLALLTALLLIISIESSSRTKRNSKYVPKMVGGRSPANQKIAKGHCTTKCKAEKIAFDKVYSKNKKKKPYEMKQTLFVRLREINTEYYVCKCHFTNSGVSLKRSYYFANLKKINIWYRYDSDGFTVYNNLFTPEKKMKMFGYMIIK
jgi:uncharacterized low-complexity protein